MFLCARVDLGGSAQLDFKRAFNRRIIQYLILNKNCVQMMRFPAVQKAPLCEQRNVHSCYSICLLSCCHRRRRRCRFVFLGVFTSDTRTSCMKWTKRILCANEDCKICKWIAVFRRIIRISLLFGKNRLWRTRQDKDYHCIFGMEMYIFHTSCVSHPCFLSVFFIFGIKKGNWIR